MRALVIHQAVALITAWVLVWGLGAGSVWAAEQAARPALTTVQLHASAVQTTGTMTLAQVATLSGPQAQAWGTLAIDAGAGRVTLSEVEHALAQAGANRATYTLTGYAVCRLEQAPRKADDQPSSSVNPALKGTASLGTASLTEAVANPQTLVTTDAAAAEDAGATAGGHGATWRSVVVATISRLAQMPADQLQITFTDSDEKTLAAPVGGDRLEVEPNSATGLGRVPLIVRRYHGDTLLDTQRVLAQVARRCRALVLTRQVARGQVLTAEDFAAQDTAFNGSDTPLTDPMQAVGQAAKGLLRQGAVLCVSDLQPPTLVSRGALMTVRCLSGGLVITTTVRALEDGAADQVIQVRNEKSRQTFSVRITGQGQGVMTVAPGSANTEGRS